MSGHDDVEDDSTVTDLDRDIAEEVADRLLGVADEEPDVLYHPDYDWQGRPRRSYDDAPPTPTRSEQLRAINRRKDQGR